MTEVKQFNLRNPIHLFAVGFGSGLLKPAPGTWGTLVAAVIYILLMELTSPGLMAYLVLVFLAFLAGIYLCDRAAKDAGTHDHPAIVWDEFVGFFVTMIAVEQTLLNIALGFALFRLFDIWKPWPIGALDKSLSGGFGIMIDDVVAGVFACALLHALQALF